MAGSPFSPKQDMKSLMAGSRFSANSSRAVPSRARRSGKATNTARRPSVFEAGGKHNGLG